MDFDYRKSTIYLSTTSSIKRLGVMRGEGQGGSVVLTAGLYKIHVVVVNFLLLIVCRYYDNLVCC